MVRATARAAPRERLAEFRNRYNEDRPHWALIRAPGYDPITPAEAYRDAVAVEIPKWQGWAK